MSENIMPHSQEQKNLLQQNWTQEVIFVNVIIDTQYIIDNYTPNQSKDNPPMIFPNRKGFNPIYMVATQENSINSGTVNLQVSASVGDFICCRLMPTLAIKFAGLRNLRHPTSTTACTFTQLSQYKVKFSVKTTLGTAVTTRQSWFLRKTTQRLW